MGSTPRQSATLSDVATPRRRSLFSRGPKGNIHDAAEKNKVEDIKALMLANPEALNALNDQEDTPLHLGCISGHFEAVEYMIKRGAAVNARNCRGNTPIHLASYGGHRYIADVLLKAKADVNCRNKWQDTPLLLACYAGEKILVEFLLGNNADLNACSGDGKTALMLARQGSHAEVAKYLESVGADGIEGQVAQLDLSKVDDKGGGSEPATARSYVVKRRDSFGRRYKGTLHDATSKGKIKIVKEFLAQGAEVTTVNGEGDTALHLAVLNDHTELVVLFTDSMSAGKVDMQNNSGNTALHVGAYMGNIQIVKILLSHGANVNATNNLNDTPLLLSCLNGNANMASFLLREKADASLASKSGKTPLSLAKELGHQQVVETLELQDKYGKFK